MIKVHIRGKKSLPTNVLYDTYIIEMNDDKTKQEVINDINKEMQLEDNFIFIKDCWIRKDTINFIEVEEREEDVKFPKWQSNIDIEKYNINTETIELKEDK